MVYLAATCMFRNEAPWLREWVEYYRLIGVERFYLFDHQSTDRPELVLADYIAEGIVHLERRDDEVGGNFMPLAVEMNRRALAMARGQVRWLIVLDSDEFIVPKVTDDLPTLLRSYEQYPAVTVSWQLFGTSNRELQRGQLLTECLTWRAERTLGIESDTYNAHVKSIVQVDRTVDLPIQHHGIYMDGQSAVNTNEVPIPGPHDLTVPTDKMQMNHYFSRDLRFLRDVKIPRRIGLGTPVSMVLEWENEINKVEDTCIHRFLPSLRARLQERANKALTGGTVYFDWERYLARYPELEATGINSYNAALHHWLWHGLPEGRMCV